MSRKFPLISAHRPGGFSSLALISILVSIFASCAFLGCGSGSPAAVSTPPPNPPPTPPPAAISVAVQAAAGTVDATDPTQLTATVTNDRNSAGVSWTLSGAGKLSGESTSAATYTAPAPTSSTYKVTVTATSKADSTKSASATITVPAGPALTLTSWVSASVGNAYSQPLTPSGGIPPYTWTLKGGTLPSCLTLSASPTAASIVGTPNSSCVGTFSDLWFQFTDSGTPNALSAATGPLQLTVTAAPSIAFPGPKLGSATYNVAYTASAAAVGGGGALTYSSTGALPPGLTLNTSSGALTGTPNVVGIYRFSVMASDGYGDSNSQPFLIGVSQPNHTPIQHVVVIMQENRTFDNLFHGFPGADTADSGSDKGTEVPLLPVPLAETVGFDHSHGAWWRSFDLGKMDGFANIHSPYPLYPYSYVQQSDVEAYWDMASQYTLGDEFFQSNSGPSFPSHLYMIAGQSADADEDPVPYGLGCDAAPGSSVYLIGPNGQDIVPGPFPCFDYKTIADLLDDGGVTWRYYGVYGPQLTPNGPFTLFSPYEAIRHIFFGVDEQTNAITPQTQVLTDIANGELAQVTWVTPDGIHSDMPGWDSNEGPDWVASVVNAVGASPFWNSTAILINWDDWGGWYDHVKPVSIDEMGPGFRTPLIVVSPYAKQGYVFHGVSETASLVTFIEKTFDLPDLHQRDAKANDLFDCFDFTQSPSPFARVKTKIAVDQLMRERPSGPPDVDDDDDDDDH